ncbi:glycosyltransferase family 2 protein [Gluconobacter roseus]|uniref:Dolichol monophosphate mannose synthase n=1 Tax=Gluconobacter roseus NBRC 3990 TaxID=1307950 RepID=A0A4Y3M5F0_9PROT|nr:glycosyltransferase family 2 protein [Gluconobacter roseus]KXV43161.1 dolichol monophosphate mannose synthase [Gluconobacter roseus]GBR43047.1 dolichol-phosphate mannosyltransferase [Gluconobacter roseus NBRC 3990]GEB03823.1 dolichol monophosphate mannose synthase [Gluconobacter roseus NBRC 3990]GLP94277.1 dolichol monophosphate mannose synthase [Gluconobacter roseus NBRC 3990]
MTASRLMPLPAELSVIVPCYNEVSNVAPMVAALDSALEGRRWEVIFVDDNSPDGTAAEVCRLAREDPRVRVLCRVGRRGLSSAVIEGILSSSAPWVAVMDGDLQHDESVLRTMLSELRSGADIVVASRHVEGGDNAGLAGKWRHLLSDVGIRAAQTVMPHSLSDPMSGFFAMRRDLFETLLPRLSGTGFKILLDLVMSAPKSVRIVEVPFVFRPRLAGESKLDVVVLLQFATMLFDKLTCGWLPTRFMAFALVGLIGVVVNVAVLNLAGVCGLSFSWAQLVGTAVAILTNFLLNNRFTYHDRRLKGPKLWRGLIIFVTVCSLGAVANIGIARMMLDSAGHGHWDRSSAAGAVVGVVWNYAVSSTLVWR